MLFSNVFFAIFNSPMEWIVVFAAIFLLFGASRLPQLAKSLGQSRREFKKAMREAEEEDEEEQQRKITSSRPSLAAISDEELLEEARRRATLRRE
jgi:sec-independent protein translocase protein TatA